MKKPSLDIIKNCWSKFPAKVDFHVEYIKTNKIDKIPEFHDKKNQISLYIHNPWEDEKGYSEMIKKKTCMHTVEMVTYKGCRSQDRFYVFLPYLVKECILKDYKNRRAGYYLNPMFFFVRWFCDSCFEFTTSLEYPHLCPDCYEKKRKARKVEDLSMGETLNVLISKNINPKVIDQIRNIIT